MVNKIFLTSVIAAMVSATLSSASNAEVVKYTDDATLQQQNGEHYFSQSGISGEKVEPIETAGADMSLAIATNLIVPDSWVVKPSGNFDNAVVSWKGGVTWPLILRNIANDEGIYISLDWVQKIVSINVPGQTESETQIAASSKELVDSERQAFRKKQRQEWERVDSSNALLNNERDQFEKMMNRQRDAQKSNQQFIAELNNDNDSMRKNLETLRAALDDERRKNAELTEQYSVINPNLARKSDNVDAGVLFERYNKAWVLPFDDSFEYYLKGGHTDYIQTLTPATYIARSGTAEKVVREWAEQVNWFVEYNAGIMHKNPYKVKFKGTFQEAAVDFVKIFANSNRPINIEFFPDVEVEMEDGTTRKGLARITDLNHSR